MKRYKKGIIIGRFQPFHFGHKHLIQKALEVCDTLVIGLGSINKYDKDNPFSIEKRHAMLAQFLEKEEVKNRIEKIIDIPDNPSDEKWFEYIMQQSRKIEVVIGNNEWVNEIFTSRKIPVITIDYLKRELYEGEKIRILMEEKKHWEDRVPYYIVETIQKNT